MFSKMVAEASLTSVEKARELQYDDLFKGNFPTGAWGVCVPVGCGMFTDRIG